MQRAIFYENCTMGSATLLENCTVERANFDFLEERMLKMGGDYSSLRTKYNSKMTLRDIAHSIFL